MAKSIQLKLSKIKYSGDSIGDDIRVEIEVLSKFLRIDKTIKVGTTVEINKDIGGFETDQKSFKTNARITIFEKDVLFNDIGSIEGDIKIDTSITKPQQVIYKVEIKETRSVLGKVWGKKTAIFEITLEANVVNVIKYIPDKGDGWLKVQIENTKTTESLPAYLKVKVEYIKNKREYFTILEGAYRNKLASVKLKKDGASHLISNIQHKPEVRATYSISKKTLTLVDGKIYSAADYKNELWKKGLYDIEIPDYPHSGGVRYEKQAPKAKTWFRIGHGGEKYLHTGAVSRGCLTVTETIRWDKIYDALIRARKPDFMSVGVLEVID
ncbi:hypothetical protein KKH14_00125 [Patescibacteria group bacterium]|nr:hypothetical protein [Patescibacteria group bacterium]